MWSRPRPLPVSVGAVVVRRARKIPQARSLRLMPDDIVVIEFDDKCSMEQAARLKGYTESLFPGHQVVVVAGARLGVLRLMDDANA